MIFLIYSFILLMKVFSKVKQIEILFIKCYNIVKNEQHRVAYIKAGEILKKYVEPGFDKLAKATIILL